ncbi:MAG: helix-turn-helix domain-containing protein, partial [Caldilineaceae bacterium]|nr:helix-turn-helix domain-containing protein [Caldilineaceae bacterium]
MNSHFNRQFILIDFRLLEDRSFLKFLGSSEFATYLVLRRNVWRSPKPHYMGLDQLYSGSRQLVCSLTREKIAEVTGVALDNISRHLSALERRGVIRRLRTGRQNIYVLGQWVDVKGDGSYKLEWFYMEGAFGVSKADLMQSVRSELTPPSDQKRRRPSDNNREENREEKTVANGVFDSLPDLQQPKAKTAYVAEEILNQLKDRHSQRFYRLVAAKVPEHVVL